MKKLILLIALALPALLTAQQRDWANYGRYAEANAQLTTPPAVVFMGNSITDGWDNAHPEFFTANNFACRRYYQDRHGAGVPPPEGRSPRRPPYFAGSR